MAEWYGEATPRKHGVADAQTSRLGAHSPNPSGRVQMGRSIGAVGKGACHLVFCCVVLCF